MHDDVNVIDRGNMSDQIQLNDEVWHRVVVIIQEAMLTGVDCADLLRQIRVQPSADGTLVLTPEYKKVVNDQHAKLLDEAEALKNAQQSARLIGQS